ncbi:hypothetical protein ACHAWU_008428 [Discostella pseudostelligera]|uniref:Uncharacterized protein n=1 Tax=Discostella pseudostelligera TaxID=259834 RepID=A0ABD3M520_9STRA
MSFIGGGIGGDAGPDRGGNRGGGGGGGASRKNTKKFGKNLNKLTKAPAAPPVPVISPGSGGGSSSSFRGSSSNRNGLLLLSTKSKSSSGGGGGGLLAASGTPKTAHDALLLSAGARDGDSTKKQPAHAWGAGGAKDRETASSVDFRGADSAAEVWTGTSTSDSTIDRRDSSLQRQRSSTHRWTEQTSSLDNRGAEKAVFPEQRDSFAGGQRPSADRWTVGDVTDHVSNMSLSKSHTGKDASNDMQLNYRSSTGDIPQANENADVRESKTEATHQNSKDYQAEYMSKLARERAEKLRLEEEARVAAQKERAAMRLRVLEEKRLEERKRLLIQNQERRELSRPSSQVILEPLGKPKKDTPALLTPKPTISAQQVEKKDDRRTLYDPDRSFSSLVGGKMVKCNSNNNTELPRGSAKQSPVHVPAISSASTDNEEDNSPKPVHMVQLSNLDELDRGGRGEGQGVQRMLFDPNSGSMIAVPSREDPKSTKKAKQKAPPKGPVDKIVIESPESKMVRGKLGKGSSRKDEPISLQQRNKKPLDKGKQTPRKRVPRTRGVLYKIDKSGNYLNVDESEPDEGYGAHLVPGGKIKNPGAHVYVVKQQEVNDTFSQPKTTSTTATDGFSFRNDPGFLQHQTNFEAQQQKILEDAWASLVENDGPMAVESDLMAKKELPATKSGDDEYAAALEISPSIIGLNFDAIDTMDSVMLPPAIKVNGSHNHEESIALTTNFGLGATSSVGAVQSANPFIGPLGGVPGASLWGTSNTGASSSAYDLSALTGWNPTPFGEGDPSTLVGSVGLTGSTSQSSKLHLWGSSALDDN